MQGLTTPQPVQTFLHETDSYFHDTSCTPKFQFDPETVSVALLFPISFMLLYLLISSFAYLFHLFSVNENPINGK